MTNNKRFITIAECQRITGLSYPTIKHAAESGQIKAIKTESGHWKIDITDISQNPTDKINTQIIIQLEGHEQLLKALCGHLGVNYNNSSVKHGV